MGTIIALNIIFKLLIAKVFTNFYSNLIAVLAHTHIWMVYLVSSANHAYTIVSSDYMRSRIVLGRLFSQVTEIFIKKY